MWSHYFTSACYDFECSKLFIKVKILLDAHHRTKRIDTTHPWFFFSGKILLVAKLIDIFLSQVLFSPCMPRMLVEYLVVESSKKLNFFPTHNGVSKYCSPRIILHEENTDLDSHCAFALGECAQGENEPDMSSTNTL